MFYNMVANFCYSIDDNACIQYIVCVVVNDIHKIYFESLSSAKDVKHTVARYDIKYMLSMVSSVM